MSLCIITGTHWGDEGKGKIVDCLSQNADVVVRAQGGSNAGHTVVTGKEKYVFHLIPSGILHPGTLCLLGDGMVINPSSLLEEMKVLTGKNLGDALKRLYISGKAHLVMPYHQLLDGLMESFRKKGKIGTTGQGIGPAYEDKVARWGIRVADLLDEKGFAEKLSVTLQYKNRILENVFRHPPLLFDTIFQEYRGYGETLSHFITDTSKMAYEAVESGQKVIIEGAQGTMLDLDHGTYPFVTSSHPASAGSLLGAGIGPVNGIEIIGICKAYTSRVGEGPFPTECRDETGEFLREKGHEYGATTGRPRRCGWLDGVVLKYAVRVNSITSLVITKLDILGGLPHIQLCTGYQVGNEKTSVVPLSSEAWNQCQPVYDELDGWEEDISEIHSYGELPAATRRYLEFIEDFTSIPVGIISVGPDRNQTIIRKEYF